ncbi:putative glycoprotein [Oberland virus]|uniref:Glycoprotein n=1 Tax=Oberland virus TaxID=2675849 RepID=A0A974LM50_9MONO|nr:putative glycoprotein [Oberland virus]QGM12360.2 putative glycoprotein [Oberland virus]
MGARTLSVILVCCLLQLTLSLVQLNANGKNSDEHVDFRPDVRGGIFLRRYGTLLKPDQEMFITNGEISFPLRISLAMAEPDRFTCAKEELNTIVHRVDGKGKTLSEKVEKLVSGIQVRSQLGNQRSKRFAISGALAIGKGVLSLITGGFKLFSSYRKVNEIRIMRNEVALLRKQSYQANQIHDARLSAVLSSMHEVKDLVVSLREEFLRFQDNITCDLQRVEVAAVVGPWERLWVSVLESLISQPFNNRWVATRLGTLGLKGFFKHLEGFLGSDNIYGQCEECTLSMLSVSALDYDSDRRELTLMISLPIINMNHRYTIMSANPVPTRIGEGNVMSASFNQRVLIKDGVGYTGDLSMCLTIPGVTLCEASEVNLNNRGPPSTWKLDDIVTMTEITVEPSFWMLVQLYDSVVVYTESDHLCRVQRSTGQTMGLEKGMSQIGSSDGSFLICDNFRVPIPQGASMTPIDSFGLQPVLRTLDRVEVESLAAGHLSGSQLAKILEQDKTPSLYDFYMSDDHDQGKMIAVNQVICALVFLVVLGLMVCLCKNRKTIRLLLKAARASTISLATILRRVNDTEARGRRTGNYLSLKKRGESNRPQSRAFRFPIEEGEGDGASYDSVE